jgi:DNA-binding transcriptional LysR family regulator|tara:strand:+ start:17045 stop:17221 length:177 start_codon:yes stop_codon:yes gene_type:complete
VAERVSAEAVKQSVKAGLGLSVLSGLAVQEELSKNVLKEVKVPHLSMVRFLDILKNKE